MLATDEGKFQGGEDTSPTPLEFFLTGWVGCLMTQIRVFSRRMKIEIDDVEVHCRARWEALPDAVAPYRGRPVGFEVDIDVTSSSDRVDDLIEAARRGCFVEQTLAQANPIVHRMRVNEAAWQTLAS
nr:OsmC family protein [Pseudohoeflea sp. DP4N28-3]